MSQENGQSTQNKPKHPGGRPPIIGPIMEREIIAIIKGGCSINDAADICEIGRTTIYDKLRNDARFRTRVDRAAAMGKKRFIQKIGKAKPWQAAAWMLERKWGEEFGKKETHEHTGKGGGPIVFDVSKLTVDELRTIRTIHDRLAPASSN